MIKTQFGKWTFNPDNYTLTHLDGYEIDLETMTSTGQMLDWIMQIASKDERVYPNEELGQLVRALDELFYPQAYYCSGGSQHKNINPVDVIKQVQKVNQRT